MKKPVLARLLPIFAPALAGLVAACNAPAEHAAPAPQIAPGCGTDAAVETSLYGGIEAQIRWSASEMACESMPRPNGEGVRVRLVGEVAGERLAFIIALPGLRPGDTAVEVPSNVTATVEGSGRFFSTPDLDSCWTEVGAHTRLSDDDTYAFEGTLFCISPLGEINGDAAVSIPELRFSTLLNWSTT